MKKNILAIISAGFWITLSEFVRNEFILKYLWVEHYTNLNLKFSTLPINGLFWTLWSLLLAGLVFILSRKFSFRDTFWLSWVAAFPMMWIVLFNLQVLPYKILFVGVPLSLLEIFVAQTLIKKITS